MNKKSLKLLFSIIFLAALVLVPAYTVLEKVIGHNESTLSSILAAQEFKDKVYAVTASISSLAGTPESKTKKAKEELTAKLAELEKSRLELYSSGILEEQSDDARARLEGGINKFVFATKKIINSGAKKFAQGDPTIAKPIDVAYSQVLPVLDSALHAYVAYKESVLVLLKAALQKYAPMLAAALIILAAASVKIVEMVAGRNNSIQEIKNEQSS